MSEVRGGQKYQKYLKFRDLPVLITSLDSFESGILFVKLGKEQGRAELAKSGFQGRTLVGFRI